MLQRTASAAVLVAALAVLTPPDARAGELDVQTLTWQSPSTPESASSRAAGSLEVVPVTHRYYSRYRPGFRSSILLGRYPGSYSAFRGSGFSYSRYGYGSSYYRPSYGLYGYVSPRYSSMSYYPSTYAYSYAYRPSYRSYYRPSFIYRPGYSLYRSYYSLPYSYSYYATPSYGSYGAYGYRTYGYGSCE